MSKEIVSSPDTETAFAYKDGKWNYGDPVPTYTSEGNIHFGEMENEDGLKLRTYFWPANCPESEVKGQVIGFHGFGVHARYEFLKHVSYKETEEGFEPSYFEQRIEGSWVERITDAGYNFHTYDHQSYGLSEGKDNLRGYFEFFEDIVDDAQQFVEQVKSEYPGPTIFLGPSMGGCIATRVLERDPDIAEALILMCPMMSLEQIKKVPINRVLVPIVDCLSSLVPTLRVGSEAENKMFPQEQEYINNDPLCDLGSVRSRVGHQCLIAVDTVRAKLEAVECPVLLFYTPNDTFVDPEGSEYLYENISSRVKEKVVLDKGISWHALISEPESDIILDKILDWVDPIVN